MAKIYKLPLYYSKLNPFQRKEVREQYVKEQKGLCYWCKKSLAKPAAKEVLEKEINHTLFPKNFFDYPIHLQHNHITDLTEGTVHAVCNAVMWQYYER